MKKITKHKNFKPIMFVILCTLFASAGQIFWKMGASNVGSLQAIFTNIPLLTGFACYGLSSILLIISLKYGDLSMIYPFMALSFVWVGLASIVIFGEFISLVNWAGIIAIIAGVSLIGYGSSR